MRVVSIERGPGWIRAHYTMSTPQLQQIPKVRKHGKRPPKKN